MEAKENLLIEQMNQDFDIQNRVIYLECEIDITIPSFLQQRVNVISQISGDNNTPIAIELTSYGGDAYAALAVIDVIRSLPMKINIHGRGAILSAGALLLISGTGTRSISKNSIIMPHSASTWLQGNTDEIINEATQLKVINDLIYQVITESSNKTIEFWRGATKSNCYLTAKEALDFGLVDQIK